MEHSQDGLMYPQYGLFIYIFKKGIKIFLFLSIYNRHAYLKEELIIFFLIKFKYINTWSIIKLHTLILQVTQNLGEVGVGSGPCQGFCPEAPHKAEGMDLKDNFMKFSTGKCKVLHRGSEAFLKQCRLGHNSVPKTLGPLGRK